MHPAECHHRQQAGGLQRHRFPARVGPRDNEQIEADAETDVDGHDGSRFGRSLGFDPENVFEYRVPRGPQPQPALGVHLGGGHRKLAAVPGFGRDEIQPGDDVEGVEERLGDPSDFGAQPPEDALHFAVFFTLQCDPLGAEVGDRRRLDEDRLPRAADAVHRAGHLVPVVHGHRQNVMVAVHRRVRIAEDFPQFRIAQEPLDFGLHLFVEFEEFLPDGGEFPAGDVEDVPPAVDAAADGPRDGAEVFDPGEEVDQAVEPFVQSHPVAVDRAGASEGLRYFEELLGAEHGADAGAAHDQSDVVQPAQRWGLLEFEREHHLRHEFDFRARGGRVRERFDLACEFAAQRRRGVTGDDLADFVELEQVERVRVHGDDRCR